MRARLCAAGGALVIAGLAGGLFAQDATDLPTEPQTETPVAEPAPGAADAPGAVLRGLDKMAGATSDLEVRNGATATFGTLKVTVSACRFPRDNPAADAWAHLSITDSAGARLFDGWMIASSPALSALDHPRYDIWVIRCMSS